MEGLCRGCLLQYNEPTDLLQYTEKNRRLFVYSTGLQVKRNDTFTFQLCKECYFNMKQSCKFKKQCRTSDKHFKNYLMLKEDGDDFGSFIKNMDENLSLRLPMTSGNSSTPAYQKNKDDDNESTCTSIRNFITDILEGEEMPPSEARLIREVIQEETDVLDDSLDSHWLQDDRSIGSDFDVDFGISPFATPRTIQNDHCYTPRRIVEAKQREINYLTSKEIIEKIDKPGIVLKYDMPLLDDMNSNMDFENVVSIQEENYIIKTEETTDNKRELSATDLFEFDNSIPSEVEDMVTENSISSTPQCFKTDLLNIAVKKEMGISVNDNSNFLNVSDITFDKDLMATTNENDICIVVNQGIAEKSIDEAPLINELEYYVNKAEIKKQITSTKDKSKYHCTIDRNLDIALKHEGNKQFSLDQLITSPADSIHSGVSTPALRKLLFGDQNTETVPSSATSTPTIKNILFGEKLDSVPKYFPQVGQSMDNLEDDKSDINILQDFFENDVNVDDEIKESNIKIEPKDFELNIENYQCNPSIEINQDEVMKSDEHIEVLEEFLRGADDDQLKLNGEIIDPLDLSNELSDKDLFKRPLTPPYNKYDLEKCLCKLCDRTFMSEKSLKIHFAKTHKYKFPNSDPHRNKSQSIKIKVCNICGKAIKGAPNYLRHMKLHQDKLIGFFQCDNCKLFFKSRMALQVHMRMHMGIVKKQKKFVCPTCGKVSATSSHHKLHIRRHLKEISDTCDFCHKGFYSAYDLKAHMRIHSGERPYVCEYCTKAFRRRNELQLHMKRHMGKLEFKCDACNIEFVSKEILAKHYASKKCIKKREEMSQKSIKDTVAVKYGKGSLEKIRKMMQSTNSEKDIESDNEEMEIQPAEIENSMIQAGKIENGIMQSTKLEKDIESDNEEMENGMIQSTEIENNMIQSAEIENGMMQSTISEKDIESDNEEIEIQSEEIENEMIQSAEIENGMMQSTKSKKDIESDNEEMENGLIQSAEIENGMMQSVEIENGMIQSA